jgi:nitrate/TMAO reductase-like tetraheme cytochrome c subunit
MMLYRLTTHTHQQEIETVEPRSQTRTLLLFITRWSLCLALSGALAASSYLQVVDAQPREVPSALTPSETVTLTGTFEMWQKRAQAWYKHSDLVGRRREMRALSRPLKRPCYYCHKRSFKGYVESTYLISLQMMAISAEQDVTCADCHIGRRGLTVLGAKSLIQWRYAQENGLDCRDCHTPNGQFRTLTKQGQDARSHLSQEVKSRGSHWGVADAVVDEWIRTLQNPTSQDAQRPKEVVTVPVTSSPKAQ